MFDKFSNNFVTEDILLRCLNQLCSLSSDVLQMSFNIYPIALKQMAAHAVDQDKGTGSTYASTEIRSSFIFSLKNEKTDLQWTTMGPVEWISET